MIIEDEQEIKDRVERMSGRRIYGRVEIVEDTTDYMRLLGGMVLRLAGKDYFISGDAREGRFGIDDQPKTWVKYAYDLADGSRKIIKLVFFENFAYREGAFLIKAHRSPEKEAHCLEVVRGDPRFMQGFSVRDPAGNLVRVIDLVHGKSLFVSLGEVNLPHEQYFRQVFPQVLAKVIGCIEGLGFLQQNGEHHGDVRNDHLIIEKDSGLYKWIDFDYHVSYQDYDLWSCGNILTFIAAKRVISFQEVQNHPDRFPDCRECALTAADALLFYKYRVANLRKLFPYIPKRLNRVLMNFSQATENFYESYDDLISDLREVQADLG